MKDDVLAGMGRIRRLGDAYAQDVVDTTFRTRNHLLDWDEGLAVVTTARASAAQEWHALQALPLEGEDKALLEQALQARVRADQAAETLQRHPAGEGHPRPRPVRRPRVVSRGRSIDRTARPHRRARATARRGIGAGRTDPRQVGRARAHRAVAAVLRAGGAVRPAHPAQRLSRRGKPARAGATDGPARLHRAAPLHAQRRVGRGDGQLPAHAQPRAPDRDPADRPAGAATTACARRWKRREHFQRLLLEAAQTAIFAVDEDGRVLAGESVRRAVAGLAARRAARARVDGLRSSTRRRCRRWRVR